ncbi:carcinine transporter [Ixodes scapularis]
MDFDDLFPHIGEFGLYQKWTYFLLCIPATLTSVFTLFNSIFISATPDHWCRVPEIETFGDVLPPDVLKELSIPKTAANDFAKCEMYDVNYTAIIFSALDAQANRQPNSSWPIRPCTHGWIYSTVDYDSTLVTQTNTVCKDAWKVSTAQSALYAGSVVGTVLLGAIGDRYGRRMAFLITVLLSLGAGIGATFSTTFEQYIAWRCIIGLTYPAIFQIPFIMSKEPLATCMELMSPEKRTFSGMFVSTIYGIPFIMLAGIAYLLRDWFTVSLATSMPFITVLVVWWFIPESPRWLLSQNRMAEAEDVVQKIAKWNGKKIPANFLQACMEQQQKLTGNKYLKEEVSLQKLASYPNLLKKVLVVTFSWTANTMVYNGLSLATSTMNISDYLSFAISGAVEVPGVLLAWAFMDKYGRRPVMVSSMLIGGLACISSVLVPSDPVWLNVSLCSLGKMSITASFATIYVYSAELFPTVLRTFAMGIVAMTGSISLIITPHILFLGQLYSIVIPGAIFGGLSAAGGFAVLLLPETMKVHLPQTLTEGDTFGGDIHLWKCMRNSRKKTANKVWTEEDLKQNTLSF